MVLARVRPASLAAQLAADAYVTDGRSLFRVVAPLRRLDGRMSAELEDCQTLTTRLYSADELWDMQLSVVQRSSAGTATNPDR